MTVLQRCKGAVMNQCHMYRDVLISMPYTNSLIHQRYYLQNNRTACKLSHFFSYPDHLQVSVVMRIPTGILLHDMPSILMSHGHVKYSLFSSYNLSAILQFPLPHFSTVYKEFQGILIKKKR